MESLARSLAVVRSSQRGHMSKAVLFSFDAIISISESAKRGRIMTRDASSFSLLWWEKGAFLEYPPFS